MAANTPNRPSRWRRLAATMVYVRRSYDLAPAPIRALFWLVPLYIAAHLGVEFHWPIV